MADAIFPAGIIRIWIYRRTFYSGDNAEVNISATITESVCTVINPSSDTNSVHLGKMRSADMHDAGSAGQSMPFYIELVNCPTPQIHKMWLLS